jgi:hypothetical protein
MRHQRSTFLTALGFVFLALAYATSALSKTDDKQSPPPSAGLSHVRVVRLSFLEGTVAVRRPGSTDWIAAPVNTPIEEGFSVATNKKSFAEVQFENGSTIWLGELTTVDFAQLALTPQGGRINHLTLDEGYATFRVIPASHDGYLLTALGVSLTPQGKSEFRTDISPTQMRVEVFNGHVRAADPSQTETLSKDHSLVRDADPAATFQVADKFAKDDWDKWTDGRKQQSTLAFNDSAVSPASPVFGWDDLDVYGSWSYFPGYGNAWTPFEPLGWSPYESGMWDSYPGMGLTWISGEPWGWLPFHFGFWNFDAGMGWFWMPGSFDYWNPAMVNWYSGPGWIGWSPVGPGGFGGSAPCTLAAAGCLTAVPPTVLSHGEPIRPGSPLLFHPDSSEAISAIARPDFGPNHLAGSPRQSSPRFSNLPSGQNGNQLASHGTNVPKSNLSASGFTRGPESAPTSIVMGRHVGVEALAGHRSSFGNSFGGSEPIRVQLGGTMGGKFPTSTIAGGRSLSGAASRNASRLSPMRVGPQALSRNSAGSFSHGAGGFGSLSTGTSSGIGRTGGMSHGNSSSGTSGGSHSGGTSSSGSSGGSGGHH